MTIATRRISQDSRMTLEDFLAYDDGTDRRYELVDGVLVEMGAESPINTWIVMFLIGQFLRLNIPEYQLGIKQLIQVDSVYVTARDPDLIVHTEDSATAFGDGRKEACLTLNDPNPSIVIEAVSLGPESTDNYQRDYVQKLREYAQRGIPEMWQIDPERSWVKIGTLVDGTYRFEMCMGNDAIISPSCPGLALTAAQVLQAGR
jgi:Uma2 family endonuclease